MRIRQLTFIPGVLALFLAEIACTINIGGPAYPNPSIPVSTEAMGDLSSAIETAVVNGTESGQIMIGITETQLTSYLSYKILALPQPFITNPQVYMENGELQLYGTATEGYFQATVSLVFSASVDEMGRLMIKLKFCELWSDPCSKWSVGIRKCCNSRSLYWGTWSGGHRVSPEECHNREWINDHSWSNEIANGLYQ